MVASATTLLLMEDWKAKWIQATIAITMLTVLGFSPLWIWGIIYKNRKVLFKPSTKSTIGSLFAGLNLDTLWQSSLIVIFLGRRVFFIVLMFAIPDYPAIQIFLFTESIMFYIIYLMNVRPYESKSLLL
jgi:hypothetical protein